MDKPSFEAALEQAWNSWQALLERCTLPARANPEGLEGWTLGDLIAHITWYEQEMVQLLETRTLAGSDLWLQPHAVRNRAIYLQNRGRTLIEVQKESEGTHAALQALVAALSEQALHDPGCFQEMPPDWIPWQIIAENTFEHYPQHADQVVAWLDEAA